MGITLSFQQLRRRIGQDDALPFSDQSADAEASGPTGDKPLPTCSRNRQGPREHLHQQTKACLKTYFSEARYNQYARNPGIAWIGRNLPGSANGAVQGTSATLHWCHVLKR